jgi:hypothetical protein
MMSIRVPVHEKHSFCRLDGLQAAAYLKPFHAARGQASPVSERRHYE